MNEREELQKQLAELENEQRTEALHNALKDIDAHNVDMIIRLLDMNALEFTDSGISGLDEQIEQMKKSDPYLFIEGEQAPKQAGEHMQTNAPYTRRAMSDTIRRSYQPKPALWETMK